ncbi:hypothetical protein [Halarcobacter anaerophilus]|uniref:Uncharacterized protein n=1 Tax=Halarcobacter anaerophilus TaxID=877500 RepID=A0A4Q0Y494_9BACT|nr:hypothetical protein [Halarcobacter anaerophilus]RXJ64603.1 hypothetical protein CRV06_01200 [Halarcobacter anaerophilus]
MDSYYIDRILSIFILLLIGVILGWGSLKVIINHTDSDTENSLKVKKIYPIYTELMPVFLSIIVIAFSLNNFIEIDDLTTVSSLFFGIFLLFSISNIGYLNPIWFLLGYRIYKVDNDKAIYTLIAHKNKNYKSIDKIGNVKKVDEFVFIKRKE